MPNLIGANMSFWREVFEHVGGFTEGLGRLGTRPLGCEETELAIRIRQRRPEARLLHEPTAVVHHHVPTAATGSAAWPSPPLATSGGRVAPGVGRFF